MQILIVQAVLRPTRRPGLTFAAALAEEIETERRVHFADVLCAALAFALIRGCLAKRRAAMRLTLAVAVAQQRNVFGFGMAGVSDLILTYPRREANVLAAALRWSEAAQVSAAWRYRRRLLAEAAMLRG